MPLVRIFSHPTTFSPVQRDALARSLTDVYVNQIKLPPFYVNVLFVDLDESHVYVGGERRSDFVRVVIEQIAREMPAGSTPEGTAYRKRWMGKLTEVVRPHILDRGDDLRLEMHILEAPRDLWRVQGLDPPPARSEAERIWAEKNEAVPWE